MTKEQLAAQLNGREYRREITITSEEAAAAKAAGLVAVYGASDDLMEFDGAICDEFDCYNGGTALVDAQGLLDRSRVDDSDDQAIVDYVTRSGGAFEIEALWCKHGEYHWAYRTLIPHATFETMMDGEPYCLGLVFALADLAPKAPTFDLAAMQPIAVHYSLQARNADGLMPAVFVVEIDGGSLGVVCLMDSPTPTSLGATAGVIAQHLADNAAFFPGAERSTERTSVRLTPFLTPEGKLEFLDAEVTFSPADKGEQLPGGQYYAPDGTLMNADGTRSIFDDVDQ